MNNKENVTVILEFLKNLANNNNKEWFDLNKSLYTEAKDSFEHLISSILLRVSSFDSSVLALTPKQCTYRIHRDLRFSSDKTPYKIHFGGYINPYGKKAPQSGYYIHLEPGNCLLGAGSLWIPNHILQSIRKNILAEIDDYLGIIESPEFTHYFPQVGFQRLKSAPRGFSKDNPYIEYVLAKDFLIEYNVPDDFFFQSDALDKIEKVFMKAKRLSDFVNDTIDEFQDSL